MIFADQIMQITKNLSADWRIPDEVELLFPYDQEETLHYMHQFYQKYYQDTDRRIFLFGINPGRFGAGVTGVPFTDPIRLAEECGIENNLAKRAELSSIFVYEFIHAFGGEKAFFDRFCLSSVCPLGFTKYGKNYNYYDDKELQASVTPHILEYLHTLLSSCAEPAVALCMGQGKNFDFFKNLNEEHHLFGHIIPLPHPRWVMQYRRKRMQEFVEQYLGALQESIRLCE